MSRGIRLGWFYLRSLLPKTKRFSFRLERGEGMGRGMVAVGYVTLVTPDAPVIDGWQGLQLSPRHPAVNYCPSARHPHISSSFIQWIWNKCTVRRGTMCVVILQSDSCLSKTPACLIHAMCWHATMVMTVCLKCIYVLHSKSKSEPHPRETAGLRLVMITLTLLDTPHCDGFRTECACRENSARTFFFAFEAAEVLIEKLYTFA